MKKILVMFILLSTILFGKINDTLSLFTEEQKQEIENTINKIEENRGVSIYLNTYSGEEGFVIDKVQRVVVLNMIKINDSNIKVELKFSKDMELDDEAQNTVEELLTANEKSIYDKQNTEYVQEMLIGVDALLENIKIEEPIVVEQEKVNEEKNSFFIEMGLAFLIIFGIIIRVLMVKYNRTLKEEIDIISRDKEK